MKDSLFRPEAVEHRRDAGFGVVVRRHRWRVAVALLLCSAAAFALAWWLTHWEVAPGRSVLAWMLERVAPSAVSAR
ncbi:hypothetical protein [Denitromonas iodatirespirans]|uniref:Uncharacterized protein n=1 Tax=Denitromonas iodatirespirans TaxID=2795389 RepID=A0A944HBX7_DENI1|nr:hypothetical protein [Denitromonas iodatirespirans]MBT0960686.1 hypothetical protein [Denitromonas iodatirespirans]